MAILLWAAAFVAVASQANAAPVAEPGCRPIAGIEAFLQPGQVLFLGELHGTVQSPRFTLAVACHGVRAGLPVIVGVELPFGEQARIDRFLTSTGQASDRAALLQSTYWQRDYQDGRTSEAMFDLLDGLRRLRGRAPSLRVVAFDAAGNGTRTRDQAMATNLAAGVGDGTDALTIVLSGNVHSRIAPLGGVERMAYLFAVERRFKKTIALDAAYSDGSAWVCTSGDATDCGKLRLRGRGPAGEVFSIEWGALNEGGHHGWYRVGEIDASPPAR